MLRVKKLDPKAKYPTKAHAGDLGYDLYSAERINIPPGATIVIKTGIALGFPEGYGGIIKDRSSIASYRQLITVAGVIDNGYVGEVGVALHNTGTANQTLEVGDKIAQLVLIPTVSFEVEGVNDLYSSDGRGEGGFGSTGT